MAFLLNSQAQGVSGKNEQSTKHHGTGPMQLHRSWLQLVAWTVWGFVAIDVGARSID